MFHKTRAQEATEVERAEMTQPALSRLERGGGIPTIAVLDRIASAVHATLAVSIPPAA